MGVFVSFWGTRGSIPTPGHATRRYGGNTSCVELRIDETLFICDGGTGMRELGDSLLRRGGDPVEAHLLFSHTHWDHIQGFPFFVPAYASANTLHVYDVGKDDSRVHRLLLGQMQSDYFPVSFSQLGSKIVSRDLHGGRCEIDGVNVTAIEQLHPGTSYGFCLEKRGVKVVYATDSELDRAVLNSEDIGAHPERPRRLPPELVRFADGADLLIADAQYTDASYRAGWGHPRASTVVDLALAAGARRLALFHHDPTQSDDDVEAKVLDCRRRVEARGGHLVVFGAREGLEMKLD